MILPLCSVKKPIPVKKLKKKLKYFILNADNGYIEMKKRKDDCPRQESGNGFGVSSSFVKNSHESKDAFVRCIFVKRGRQQSRRMT
jgi:hypothetical protein